MSNRTHLHLPSFGEVSHFDSDRSDITLIFLHGLLGCKEDWLDVCENIAPRYRCMALDIPFHTLDMESVKKELAPLGKIGIVGYSLGGRIAFMLREIADSLIAISSHTGLTSEKERQERILFHQKWSDLFHTLPIEEAVDLWYRQPIFSGLYAHPNFPTIFQRRIAQNGHLIEKTLDKFGVEKFPPYAPQARDYFLVGENDSKYVSMYKSVANVHYIENATHAPHLENSEATVQTLLKILKELYP